MKNYKKVKSSGKRSNLKTGSHRDYRQGKGFYYHLPPTAIDKIALHFENGAKAYGKRNWEKGQPTSWYIDSAMRHLFKYLAKERKEDHLAAAGWNIMCLIETLGRIEKGNLPKELDDIFEIED